MSATTEREEEMEDSGSIGTSWGDWKTSKNRSTFTDDFRPDESRQIVKFLDGEPFAVVDRHWIDKRPYLCPASIGQPCPLCRALGDRPTSTAFLTLAVMGSSVDITRWAVTGRVARQLSDYVDDPVIRSLDRRDLYFSVQKSAGTKPQSVVVTILPVKERDLAEDYGISPLTDDELAKYKERRLKADSLKFPTQDELTDVVRKQMSRSDSDY